MRFLYIAQNFQPMNASSITTCDILRKLAERGHETTLIVPKRCPEELMPSCWTKEKNEARIVIERTPTLVPYYVLNSHRKICSLVLFFCHVFVIIQALREAKKKKFDLVVSQHHSSHLASFSAFITAFVCKLPFVAKTHDVYDIPSNAFEGLYLHLLDNLYHVILRHAGFVLVVSSPLRSKIIETHKLKKDKVLVFPNGVDTNLFKPNKDFSHLQHAFKVDGKKVLLFTGGITAERGLSLLVEAVPKITAKDSNVAILIVGYGPQKSELEKLALRLGVEKFVRFVPPVEYREMPSYICLADVTIGPLVARLDTFGSVPRKVLEYMACAKPVVACQGGVSSDLIRNGYNGFLIRPGDADELASTILKIINGPGLAEKVGRNAERHVKEFHDWDKIIDEFEQALQRLNG